MEFLDDMEGKVRLLARHALFLQLAAESNDCGKHHHHHFSISISVSISTFLVPPSKLSSTPNLKKQARKGSRRVCKSCL